MAQAAAVTSLVVVGIAAAVVWYAIHRLRRRNRVSPRRRTSAPLNWLWSFRPAARLHRRLRTAVLTAQRALDSGGDGCGPWPALVELAADIEQQACAIDTRLVVAGQAPVALRRKLVIDLTVQVVEVEHLTGRLVGLAQRTGAEHGQQPDGATGTQRIRERLDALDEALAELDGPRLALTPGERQPPLAWPRPAPRHRTGGRATGSSAR
jgi:hypothetical protein